MPRQATLRKRNGHWFTQAGSRQGTYFGRVDEVPYREARRLFGKLLASQKLQRRQVELPVCSVVEVCNRHLEWVLEKRSDALYKQRKCLLTGFCYFRVGDFRDEKLPGRGFLIGQLRAQAVVRDHVEAYLDHRRSVPSKVTGKPLGDKGLRSIVIALQSHSLLSTALDEGCNQIPHKMLALADNGRPVVHSGPQDTILAGGTTAIAHHFRTVTGR